MRNLLIIFFIISSFTFAKENIEINTFVGHDFYGKVKVDRNDISFDYSNYNFNGKFSVLYKVYNSIYLSGNIQYESYYLNEFDSKYNLIPITIGIRYLKNEKNVLWRPYVSLSVGTSITLNEENIPIDTEVNGFGELDTGFIYKDKYLFELAYKHQAFKYKPLIDSENEFWNGQILSFNLGYKF